MPSFAHYQPAHRRRLQERLGMPQWRRLAGRGTLDRLAADVTTPPARPDLQKAASAYLIQANGPAVQALIDEGVTDEDQLIAALGDWPAALTGGERLPIVFLGLAVTMDCSFSPRCLYCNQDWMASELALADWKHIVAEAAEPTPPYVYITGGEPLVLGGDIWGDDGLAAFATQLGCAVNVNTNAELITPEVALQLTRIGLARLHISLDSPDPQLQDRLLGGAGRMDDVLAGVFNVQIARELLGVNHPQIHVNCVLTSENIVQFPDLLRFLLEIRQVRPLGSEGSPAAGEFFMGEFAFHVIPVGGAGNAGLRPTAEQWKRFYSETWAQAEDIWHDYQTAADVPAAEQRPLTGSLGVAASPYLRVDHRMDLDEYCRHAARGEYWGGALSQRCLVAGCQAFILPDGSQHWCGGHAIARPVPLGNVRDAAIRETIRANISRLAECPNEFCTGCAGATCVINQVSQRQLQDQIRQWLQQRQPSHSPQPPAE